MKKSLIPMLCAVAIAGFTACNSSNTSTTTSDSTQTTGTTATTEASGTSTATSSSSTQTGAGFSSSSYVDLKSGKTIKVRRDTATGYATNSESNEPIMYYYDPVSNDTFDRSGRMINGAIMKGTSGDWTIDESRIKDKTQSDGDIKMKDEDTKVKIDADGNNSKVKTEDTKMKSNGDDFKSKGPDGKVKIKDDKMKVKTNGQ